MCIRDRTRGGAVFTGTVEEARFFLQGVEFMLITDQNLGLSNEKKRKTAEIKYAERVAKLEAARRKKEEQKRIWQLLKYGVKKKMKRCHFNE